MWTLEQKRDYSREYMRNFRKTDKFKETQKKYYARPEVKAKKLEQWHGWYNRHPEKKHEWTKRWAKENPDKIRFSNTKQYARRKTQYKVGNADISKLLEEWNGLCGICKEIVEDSFHIDHIIPLIRGGLHEQDNIQVTHPLCNWRKNRKTPEEMGMAP